MTRNYLCPRGKTVFHICKECQCNSLECMLESPFSSCNPRNNPCSNKIPFAPLEESLLSSPLHRSFSTFASESDCNSRCSTPSHNLRAMHSILLCIAARRGVGLYIFEIVFFLRTDISASLSNFSTHSGWTQAAIVFVVFGSQRQPVGHPSCKRRHIQGIYYSSHSCTVLSECRVVWTSGCASAGVNWMWMRINSRDIIHMGTYLHSPFAHFAWYGTEVHVVI